MSEGREVAPQAKQGESGFLPCHRTFRWVVLSFQSVLLPVSVTSITQPEKSLAIRVHCIVALIKLGGLPS